MGMSNEETLKAVCFAILMQSGSGIISKAPSYVLEKHRTSSDTYSAYAVLDSNNQEKVRQWSKEWNFPLDDFLKRWASEK